MENKYLIILTEIAKKNNGKLLSTEWLGVYHKYDFIDLHNNKFKCSYVKLKKGQWTPDRGLISEPICRQVLEFIFSKKFTKTRKVLTSTVTKKYSLELDGYCDELKIAFEYQGHPSHWDHNHKLYEQTVKRDELKFFYCKNLGIKLIQIPRFKNNNFISKDVYKHVLNAINLVINIEDYSIVNNNKFQIRFENINHSIDMLQELKEIAEKNNGKLLSNQWKGSKEKYLFKNNIGEEFYIIADNLKRKGWPKILGNLKDGKYMLERLNKIAQENNGKLLSIEWKGAKKKYDFISDNKIKFKISWEKLRRNGWPKRYLTIK